MNNQHYDLSKKLLRRVISALSRTHKKQPQKWIVWQPLLAMSLQVHTVFMPLPRGTKNVQKCLSLKQGHKKSVRLQIGIKYNFAKASHFTIWIINLLVRKPTWLWFHIGIRYWNILSVAERVEKNMCGHTKICVATHIFVSALYVTNQGNVWTKKICVGICANIKTTENMCEKVACDER